MMLREWLKRIRYHHFFALLMGGCLFSMSWQIKRMGLVTDRSNRELGTYSMMMIPPENINRSALNRSFLVTPNSKVHHNGGQLEKQQLPNGEQGSKQQFVIDKFSKRGKFEVVTTTRPDKEMPNTLVPIRSVRPNNSSNINISKVSVSMAHINNLMSSQTAGKSALKTIRNESLSSELATVTRGSIGVEVNHPVSTETGGKTADVASISINSTSSAYVKAKQTEQERQHPSQPSLITAPKNPMSIGKIDLPTIPFPRSNESNFSDFNFDEPRLWIHVESFKEGIANWRPAFAEIMIVARALNATIVEPCIQRGYLISCRCCERQLRLSDIYEMDKLKEFHPSIVSLDIYEHMTTIKKLNLIKLCMHSGIPSDSVACSQGATRQPATNYFKKDKELEQLLKDAVEASLLDHTALEFVSYRRGTFVQKPYKGKKLVGRVKVRSVSAEIFAYRQEHHDIVDRVLLAMGIKGDFDVIHWRAEVKDLQYMICAEEILRVRSRLNATGKDVVLLSSLNNHSHLQWSGTKRYTNDDSKKALEYLVEAGLKKSDAVWQDTRQIIDVVLLAVWDLILATKADQLATCGKECGGWCKACGHLGQFAQTAIQSRLQSGKNLTYNCWPPA